jgi:EF hand domain-containing protein
MSGLCSPPMRLVLALALLNLSVAFAQEKPAATPPKDENASESASGGATAPRPSFRRDASSSQALFNRLDKNRDGYLTGTELTSQEALSTNWLGVDRDGDGRISRDEFTAVNPSETARR